VLQSVTNNNTRIKYLESVLQATFIGISYSTVHGTVTVYEYDTIRLAHWHMHLECVFHFPTCNL